MEKDDLIKNKIELKLEKKSLHHKAIQNNICPKCGGDLYQSTDSHGFVDKICEECGFEKHDTRRQDMPLCDTCGKNVQQKNCCNAEKTSSITEVKTLISKINKQKETISKSRDVLKDLYDDLIDTINSFDSGIEELENGMDEISRAIDSISETV